MTFNEWFDSKILSSTPKELVNSMRVIAKASWVASRDNLNGDKQDIIINKLEDMSTMLVHIDKYYDYDKSE